MSKFSVRRNEKKKKSFLILRIKNLLTNINAAKKDIQFTNELISHDGKRDWENVFFWCACQKILTSI